MTFCHICSQKKKKLTGQNKPVRFGSRSDRFCISIRAANLWSAICINTPPHIFTMIVASSHISISKPPTSREWAKCCVSSEVTSGVLITGFHSANHTWPCKGRECKDWLAAIYIWGTHRSKSEPPLASALHSFCPWVLPKQAQCPAGFAARLVSNRGDPTPAQTRMV